MSVASSSGSATDKKSSFKSIPYEEKTFRPCGVQRVLCDKISINPIGALGVNSSGTYTGGVNCDGLGVEGTYALSGSYEWYAAWEEDAHAIVWCWGDQ